MCRRLFKLVLLLGLLLAFSLTLIQISHASNTCVIIGANCVDNGCGTNGGSCGSFQNCKCIASGQPPE